MDSERKERKPELPEIPLSEHPDPYFERPGYFSLNGDWSFQMGKDPSFPKELKETITVPFAVESRLSGIGRKVMPDDWLFYKKEIHFPSEFVGRAGRIVFTAVDQVADVFIDGKKAAHHAGGYLPFEAMISEVKPTMELSLIVHDDTRSEVYPRGKQSLKPGGIWYTATSGIYGPVYFESFPRAGHIKNIFLFPDFDRKMLQIKAEIAGVFSPIVLECYIKDHKVGEATIGPSLRAEIDHSGDFFPWSAENPSLYRYVAKMGRDEVRGVYSFRKVERRKIGRFERILLNGNPIFLNGLLDQGYNQEGGLTYPSYQAMEDDIRFAKSLGYNYLRKHIKIEPRRFYYLCDKIGIYVGQDFVNGGSKYSFAYMALRPFLNFDVDDLTHSHLGRKNPESRAFFENSMEPTVAYLFPSSSILVWTLFNEGWGQFDSDRLAAYLKSLDPTRLIDATSGWYDKGSGDFSSHHVYFRKVRIRNDGRRILALSEFGGYSCREKGHCFSKKSFGYRFFKNDERLSEAIEKLYLREIEPLVREEGLSVLVYTELSDVEEEVNGLVTFDREKAKVDPSKMKAIMQRLEHSFEQSVKERR